MRFTPFNKKQKEKEKRYCPKTSATIFEQWRGLAEPILADIIEKNGSKLEGLIFYQDIPSSSISYSSGSGINKICVNGDGTYSLSIGDKSYPENLTPMGWKDTPERLAFKMLGSLQTIEYPTRLINKRRNQLVREIEKRTGRNLKKEIVALINN